MKNLPAQKVLEDSVLKKIDHLEVVNVRQQSPFHVVYIDHASPLEQKINLFLKSCFDLFASFVLIVGLLSWLFPIIALLIKIDSKGPVLFFQKRNKKKGMVFTCIKFRTMIVNEEADLTAATEDDGRVTRVGKFLRRHHLDELPQLINVLCGDMSMIGPRPYMLSDNEKYASTIQNYRVRFRVKPGITGLAQVQNSIPIISKDDFMQERVHNDIYYINNWSPALDAKIIFRTFFRMTGIK